MKKFLSIILSILLIVSVVPMGLFTITASAATSGYYTYTVSNGKATITDVATYISGAVTIPSNLGGYPVTSIGRSAFSGCSSLRSITIPDSVTSIGDSAFYGCTGLTSIAVDNNNNFSSQDGVLFNKDKTELILYPANKASKTYTIPDSLTKIGEYAFYKCTGLTSITIPDSVTSIGIEAFYNCDKLTSITIPDSVTSIGAGAFRGCSKLESITLPFVGENADGAGFVNFGYIFGANGKSYPYFDNAKFVTNSLRNVTITGSNAIAENAFYGCNYLQTVNFVGNVKILGDWVFGDCTGLKKVTLPVSCKKIGSMSFYDCLNLEDVYFLGTEGQKNIEIYHGNDMLENVATWHYNSCYGSDEHSYGDDEYCLVCNALKYIPGDLDGVEGITDRDAVHLLYHTFLPDLYPVNQDCDFNNDGYVNDKDAVYLLYYTFLPDLYPLN